MEYTRQNDNIEMYEIVTNKDTVWLLYFKIINNSLIFFHSVSNAKKMSKHVIPQNCTLMLSSCHLLLQIWFDCWCSEFILFIWNSFFKKLISYIDIFIYSDNLKHIIAEISQEYRILLVYRECEQTTVHCLCSNTLTIILPMYSIIGYKTYFVNIPSMVCNLNDHFYKGYVEFTLQHLG